MPGAPASRSSSPCPRRRRGGSGKSATLKQLLRQHAPALTLGMVLEKLAAVQLLDMHFPTTDGRELVFIRDMQPEPDQQLLHAQLGWGLPEQARPRISAKSVVAV
jgi:hypothetical protein